MSMQPQPTQRLKKVKPMAASRLSQVNASGFQLNKYPFNCLLRTGQCNPTDDDDQDKAEEQWHEVLGQPFNALADVVGDNPGGQKEKGSLIANGDVGVGNKCSEMSRKLLLIGDQTVAE